MNLIFKNIYNLEMVNIFFGLNKKCREIIKFGQVTAKLLHFLNIFISTNSAHEKRNGYFKKTKTYPRHLIETHSDYSCVLFFTPSLKAKDNQHLNQITAI